MKKVLQLIHYKLFVVFTWSLTNMSLAFAQDSDNPFEKMKEKTDLITEGLGGQIAVAVCALAICIAGIGLLIGKLTKETAIKIIVGSVIVGSASGIAQFLIGDE